MSRQQGLRLPERSGRSLRASSALGWSFANTAVSKFGTMLIGVVLARVLGPEEFGTYAVALVALVAMLSFNELGVSLAIVRWPEDPDKIAPTVTTLALGCSVLITSAVYVVAPTFASLMHTPAATWPVRVLSLSILINGAVATPAALLQRQFRQDKRMVTDQVQVWIGALTSVTLALSGLGAMGLVIGQLAGSLAAAVLYIRFSPLPYRVGFEVAQVRRLLAFGVPLAGASMVVFASSYADQLVVGRFLGPTALGCYVLATNLSNWPVRMLSQPLRNVAPAMFARLQHDHEQMSAALGRMVRPLLALAIPSCIAISAASPEIVRLVYGDAWLPAAGALRWLAVCAALRIFFELAYDYVVVFGRTSALLIVQAAWLVILLPAAFVGARFAGIAGVGLAQAVVAAGAVLPMYLQLFRRVGVRLGDFMPMAGTAVAVSLGLAAIVLVITATSASTVVGVAASAAVTLGVVGALLLLHRRDVQALRDFSTPVGA